MMRRAMAETTTAAMRATIPGGDEALRDALLARAGQLGLLGWVRYDADADDRAVRIHVEGPADAVAALREVVAPHAEEVRAKVEGHEQLAVRGVPHGVFVVQEHAATAHHFDLRLEVGGAMRSWALPKGPTLDPSVKRMAIEVGDHQIAYNDFEGRTGSGRGVVIWDRGEYEQGGRVAWPEALDRGHAVFVLHGEKLRGGFVLQRTRGRGEKAQWLLLKRRDDEAKPGSDIVAEEPRSVASGRTLDELIG